MVNSISSKEKNTISINTQTKSISKKGRINILVQTMKPNGYSALERKRLREFEKSIMSKNKD